MWALLGNAAVTSVNSGRRDTILSVSTYVGMLSLCILFMLTVVLCHFRSFFFLADPSRPLPHLVTPIIWFFVSDLEVPGGGTKLFVSSILRSCNLTELHAHELKAPPDRSDMASLDDVLGALAVLQQEVTASRAETAALKAQVEALQKNPFDIGFARSSPRVGGAGISAETSSPITVNIPAHIPLAVPERYSGNPNTVQVFLTQVVLHFTCRPLVFQTNQARVAFLISYLSGDAASWAVPLVAANDSILTDWQEFKAEFIKVFDRRATTFCADKELLELTQGRGDLVSYLTAFNRLIAETAWPDAKRSALYYKGLSEELKVVLANIDPQPATCADLINLTLRLDHRMAERRGDKRGGDRGCTRFDKGKTHEDSPTLGGEPMDIGLVRSSLSKEEREVRRRYGQCLYCGRKGHYVRECPMKPQNRGPFGKFRKASWTPDKKAEN